MPKEHHQHKKHHKNHRHDKDKDQHHRKKKINNPIIKAVLEGVYDDNCVLSNLRGCPHLLKVIWGDVRSHCLAQIKTPNKNQQKNRMRNDQDSEGEVEEGEEDKGI